MAIGLVMMSGLLYTLAYSLAKSLVVTDGMTALQITFLRCSLVLGASVAAAMWPGTGVTWTRIWLPARAWEQRLAAATLVISNVLAIVAFALLPVTTASALGFTAPLLLTALGGLMLRERISVARWLGAAMGFAGAVLILNPRASPAPLGVLASLGSAGTYAVSQVLMRRLRGAVSSLDAAVQVALVGAVSLVGTMAVFWRQIGAATFGMVVVVTVLQTVALASLAAALQRSEASRLAPWQFFSLLWAMLLDLAMFGTQPSAVSMTGAGCIILGGVLAHASRRAPSTEAVAVKLDGRGP